MFFKPIMANDIVIQSIYEINVIYIFENKHIIKITDQILRFCKECTKNSIYE